eukprot:scaffold29634_cov171-Amphora_coffeaeformis.AAC.2
MPKGKGIFPLIDRQSSNRGMELYHYHSTIPATKRAAGTKSWMDETSRSATKRIIFFLINAGW